MITEAPSVENALVGCVISCCFLQLVFKPSFGCTQVSRSVSTLMKCLAMNVLY